MGSEARSEDRPIHVVFFPFMDAGHLIPMSDMAKLFARRGCRSTIISIHSNQQTLSKSVEGTKNEGHDIQVVVVKIPLEEAGLPKEYGDIKTLPRTTDAREKFMRAVRLLDRQLEALLEEQRPDCLIADMFLPWTTEVADKFGIPRLVFHGTGNFSLGGSECIRLYQPHNKVSSDTEPFVIPNFPGEITMTRSKLPEFFRDESSPIMKFFVELKKSETKSFGLVVNSFYELEPAYVDHYRNVLGRRSWQIGPLRLSNNDDAEDKSFWGEKASIDRKWFLSWMDSKETNSVVYICFGSMTNFNSAQLQEIAVGLESSGRNFIWVVQKDPDVEEGKEEWLPEGYEERTSSRGLILRGWAPQVVILEHPSVGAFVTHCGWNSTLEAISAGVPMVTWPVAAEQFYNEALLTDVLGIGVPVGAMHWIRVTGDSVSAESVERAVLRVTTGDESEGLRSRVKELSGLAKRAVEEGGSSYAEFSRLIEELRAKCRYY